MTLYRVPLKAVVLVDALVEAASGQEAIALAEAGLWNRLDMESIDSGSWCDWALAGAAEPEA